MQPERPPGNAPSTRLRTRCRALEPRPRREPRLPRMRASHERGRLPHGNPAGAGPSICSSTPPCHPGGSARGGPRPCRVATRVSHAVLARDPRRLRCDHRPTPRVGLGCSCGGFCGIVRAAGLADLGRRVELVDHSVRRGEGDPELADVLRGRLRSRTVRATGAATSSHTANHPGTPGPAAKRRATRLREIVTAWVELSPVTSGSISEAARRPDWRAPCIHARFPEECSPAK